MAVTKPLIVQIAGSPANAYSDRGAVKVEAIIVHTAAGSLTGIDSWFSNPSAQAGTHFAVGRAGELHQYFTYQQGPFAHGRIEPGYTAKLVDANPNVSPNFWGVGIEHDDLGRGALPTEAQLKASAHLAAWLWQEWIQPHAATTGATIDRDHFLRHGDISPQSRPNCPGWPEPYLIAYIERVRALLTETVAPKPPTPPKPPKPPPPPTPPVDPRDARIRTLQDALTVTALAYDEDAARATIRAATLRTLIGG